MSKEAEDGRLRELARDLASDQFYTHDGNVQRDINVLRSAFREAIAPYAERIAELEQRRMVDESIIVDAAERLAALTEACAEAERLLREFVSEPEDRTMHWTEWVPAANALLAKLAALGVGGKG